MDKQPVLFNVPEKGQKRPRRTPKEVEKVRVNREVAKERYYLHTCLDPEHFKLYGTKRLIVTDYPDFDSIPVGQRYYISQLLKLKYNVQYELPIK